MEIRRKKVDQFAVRLEREQFEAFCALARAQGYSGSSLVRVLIRRVLRGEIPVEPRHADDAVRVAA